MSHISDYSTVICNFLLYFQKFMFSSVSYPNKASLFFSIWLMLRFCMSSSLNRRHNIFWCIWGQLGQLMTCCHFIMGHGRVQIHFALFILFKLPERITQVVFDFLLISDWQLPLKDLFAMFSYTAMVPGCRNLPKELDCWIYIWPLDLPPISSSLRPSLAYCRTLDICLLGTSGNR